MEKIVHKNYLHNLELQSLHFWFKNAPSQRPSTKCDNISKIMHNTVNKFGISSIIGASSQQFRNSIQRPHVNFYDRIILKNVFKHWKVYVIHKLYARRATYKADYFYQKKLQKRIFNALSRNVLFKWEYIVSSMENSCTNKSSVISSNTKKTEEHYFKYLLKKCFQLWCNYVAMRNRKKELFEEAVQFHNLYCLKKCIIKWRMYIILRRRRKNQIDEVRKLYTKKVLRKCLKAWINVCEITLQKDQTECAIVYHENKLLTKCFCTWKTYHEYKVKKLSTEKQVSAYNRKKLLKRYFEQFILYTNESVAEKLKNGNAEIFYNTKLMRKVFFTWQNWYNKKVEDAAKICKIKTILQNRAKRTVLITWRLYVIHKKCKRRKRFTAQNFYKKKLIAEAFRKLYDYVIYRKEKKDRLSYLNDKREKLIEQLQIIYIEKWRDALYSAVQEKQKLHRSIKLWEFNLIRKYFLGWIEFSQRYKIKMVRKNELNEIATGFLLKKYILHWHSRLQSVLDEHRKENLATSTNEKKIIRKYFVFWKEYIVRKVKMKRDTNAAMELHKKLLLREGLKEILRSSLRNIDSQRETQLKHAAMRSFQNFELLKEYFDKWHSLIYLKNKAELRYKNSNSSESQFLQTQTSCINIVTDSLETNLVLPEYMMDKSTISKVYDSIAKLPQERWSFNLFQPF